MNKNAAESDVAALACKLLDLLKKRPAQAPYDYQEYEPLRSGMPMRSKRQSMHFMINSTNERNSPINAKPRGDLKSLRGNFIIFRD